MIDFAKVRGITIPEGEVSVICRGAEVLWRKQRYKCEVEYLRCTGTQWIDTRIIGTENISFELKIKTNGINQKIFGARGGTSANNISVFVGSPADPRIGIDFNNSDYSAYRCQYGYDGSVILSGGKTSRAIRDAGGVVLAENNTLCIDTISTPMTLRLFDVANGFQDNLFLGDGYYGKMWSGDTLIRDYIPVIDWNDRPCMYDRVTDELFYNQGTGEFIAGRQIHPVEWLGSTGTQWINTNYAFKDDFSWEIDFEGIEPGNTVFGGRTATARTAILYQYIETNATTCPIGSLNGLTTPFQLGDLSSGRHTVKMAVASNKGSVWVDGVQKYNNTEFAGAYISGTAQAIFADNFGGGDIREYASSKAYGVRMQQGANLVRDYIPAHDENGVGFMFDRVTHTIFDNAGTGEFLYGGEVA